MGLGAGLVLGDAGTQTGKMVSAGLVQLPAILVVGGCALVAVAVAPRLATPLAWTVVIAATFLGPMFGPPLGVPDRWLNISPFTHVPTVPATDPALVPLVVLTSVGMALAAAAATAIRHRSLVLPA